MTVADVMQLAPKEQDVDDATLDRAEAAEGVAERDVTRMALEIKRRRAADLLVEEDLDATVRELAKLTTGVDIGALLSKTDAENLRAFRDLLSAVLGE